MSKSKGFWEAKLSSPFLFPLSRLFHWTIKSSHFPKSSNATPPCQGVQQCEWELVGRSWTSKPTKVWDCNRGIRWNPPMEVVQNEHPWKTSLDYKGVIFHRIVGKTATFWSSLRSWLLCFWTVSPPHRRSKGAWERENPQKYRCLNAWNRKPLKKVFRVIVSSEDIGYRTLTAPVNKDTHVILIKLIQLNKAYFAHLI